MYNSLQHAISIGYNHAEESMMTKLLGFQTKYNLNMKSHIYQTIHKLSAACYALWPMFHFSNIGTFQSTYFAAWGEKRWVGDSFKV
jgi:hypothetical protein